MKTSILFSSIIGVAYAASPPTIVGVGSSYSSGVGLKSPIGQNITDRLNGRPGAQTKYQFVNAAKFGTTLAAVSATQALQLSGLNVSAVYLVSGGNDMNYYSCLVNPSQGFCQPGNFQPSTDEFVDRYKSALNAIRCYTGNNTNIPIYAVTYPRAIGDATVCPSGYCSLSTAEEANALLLYNTLVNNTVQAIGEWENENPAYANTFVPIWMRGNSANHEVGSAAPWINGGNASLVAANDGQIWHPNQVGANATAGFIYNDLKSRLPL